MEITPSLQVRTVIKALQDVLLPALDPDNKLAQEQAGLCIATLQIVLDHLPRVFAFERDRLQRSINIASELEKLLENMPALSAKIASMSEKMEHGVSALARAQCGPTELEAANQEISGAISSLVTATYGELTEQDRRRFCNMIIETAGDQLLRSRSWLIAQGWEADPQSVPSIDELLASSQRNAK